jgi:hypothetical protein
MVADAGPLLRIVSIVFPIFAVVAIGWGYARYRRTRGGIDMAFANELNMDVFVPALVISAMVTKSFELASYQWLALGAVLVMLGSGALGLGAGDPAARRGQNLRAAGDVRQCRQHGPAADGAGLRRGRAAGGRGAVLRREHPALHLRHLAARPSGAVVGPCGGIRSSPRPWSASD